MRKERVLRGMRVRWNVDAKCEMMKGDESENENRREEVDEMNRR